MESNAEVASGDYGLWVLPPGTTTRALRFIHAPAAGDPETAGHLAGVWLLPDRFGNVAPEALVQSRAHDDVSMKLVWSNKATAITADVPSEAGLTPKLWGQWRVR